MDQQPFTCDKFNDSIENAMKNIESIMVQRNYSFLFSELNFIPTNFCLKILRIKKKSKSWKINLFRYHLRQWVNLLTIVCVFMRIMCCELDKKNLTYILIVQQLIWAQWSAITMSNKKVLCQSHRLCRKRKPMIKQMKQR